MSDIEWHDVLPLLVTLEMKPGSIQSDCIGPMLVSDGKEVWAASVSKCVSVRGDVLTFWHVHGACGRDWENEFPDPTYWAELPKPPCLPKPQAPFTWVAIERALSPHTEGQSDEH